MRPTVRPLAVACAVLLPFFLTAPANAHSLDSSTLSVRIGADAVTATVSVALETAATALGTADPAAVADELANALVVTGADGAVWAESWSAGTVEQVEGITSLSLDVVLDPAGADPSSFVLAYDGLIAQDPTHEAVVVLTDAAGDISTLGVLDAGTQALPVGDGVLSGAADMVGLGLNHVLSGGDHLLFILTLLLVAPLAVSGRRWVRGRAVMPTARSVVAVITAFTAGHSLTLMASALSWVSLPSAPVEVLVAMSVAVAAAHALRPLAPRGEVLVAAGFGLVHGLAFAGILRDLGLDGNASVAALLAFNIGVELAQLLTVALVLPSLLLAARTRGYAVLRCGVAALALLAASGWAVERLGGWTSPLAGVEDALVQAPMLVVGGLAVAAVVCWIADHRRGTAPAHPDDGLVLQRSADLPRRDDARSGRAASPTADAVGPGRLAQRAVRGLAATAGGRPGAALPVRVKSRR